MGEMIQGSRRLCCVWRCQLRVAVPLAGYSFRLISCYNKKKLGRLRVEGGSPYMDAQYPLLPQYVRDESDTPDTYPMPPS